MILILILFWAAVLLITYTYILFPLIVFIRGLVLPRTIKSAEITPRVSMIIAAHNEERVIGAKLDNILSLDYPRRRLEVLIASDGSNDDTNTIVKGYLRRGVTLLSLPRQGKAQALNAAVAPASGEILVFSDANSIYAQDAIRALVKPLADPKVGAVAGNQCYMDNNDNGLASHGEKSYWNLDRKLKQFQSKAGNAISATGAIYAIRRKLFRPVPTGVTDDFVISTGVIPQGYRLVFSADAIAYEPTADSSGKEFKRKVRVITRGLRAVLWMRELFNPLHYGFYGIQLFSHKLLRRLAVLPLLALLVLSPLLWPQGLAYQTATLVQIGFYSLATLGIFLERFRLRRAKVFSIPLFFCMVNIASLCAIFNILRGHQINHWEPQHHSTCPNPVSNQGVM